MCFSINWTDINIFDCCINTFDCASNFGGDFSSFRYLTGLYVDKIGKNYIPSYKVFHSFRRTHHLKCLVRCQMLLRSVKIGMKFLDLKCQYIKFLTGIFHKN